MAVHDLYLIYAVYDLCDFNIFETILWVHWYHSIHEDEPSPISPANVPQIATAWISFPLYLLEDWWGLQFSLILKTSFQLFACLSMIDRGRCSTFLFYMGVAIW